MIDPKVKRNVYIGMGIFLILTGILPFFDVTYGSLTKFLYGLSAVCGLTILVLR